MLRHGQTTRISDPAVHWEEDVIAALPKRLEIKSRKYDTLWGFFLRHFRVGIIGEPISGFNPLTLAPFGEEQEEDTGVEDASRQR